MTLSPAYAGLTDSADRTRIEVARIPRSSSDGRHNPRRRTLNLSRRAQGSLAPIQGAFLSFPRVCFMCGCHRY